MVFALAALSQPAQADEKAGNQPQREEDAPEKATSEPPAPTTSASPLPSAPATTFAVQPKLTDRPEAADLTRPRPPGYHCHILPYGQRYCHANDE